MTGYRWTQSEEDYISDKWGVTSAINISVTLGKTVDSVRRKAERMELGAFRLATDEIMFSELVNVFGRSYHNAYRSWEKKHGLPITKRILGIKRKYKFVKYDEFWKWAEDHKKIVDFSQLEENTLGPEPDWVKVKRAADKMKPQRTQKKLIWSNKDDERLKQLIKLNRMTYAELTNHLGRTESAIRTRIDVLGLKMAMDRRVKRNASYTESEKSIMRSMAIDGHAFETIAKKIGRNANGVRCKLNKMNFDTVKKKFREE